MNVSLQKTGSDKRHCKTFYDTSYWYYKFCRGVGGLILVVGIREKQIICLSESFLNSFLLVSSENTPPLNIFVMFKRTPLRFFKDVLKCPLLKKVLFLAKRVVGNLFFNLILCFPNKKLNFKPIFFKKCIVIQKKGFPTTLLVI